MSEITLTKTDSNMLPVRIYSSTYITAGSRNLQTGNPCADVIFTRKYDSFFFFSLADGQSLTNHGAEGDLASLEAIAALFHKQGLSSLFSYPFPDEFSYILMQQIRNCLTTLSQRQGYAFSEYASTLNAIAIDPTTGHYILLHLGDGCTIGVKQDNSLFFKSSENRISTSSHLADHFKACRFAFVSGFWLDRKSETDCSSDRWCRNPLSWKKHHLQRKKTAAHRAVPAAGRFTTIFIRR